MLFRSETQQEHITNNMEPGEGKNQVAAVDTERYGRYVQIRLRKDVDSKTVKILTPKEVVFEGGRKILLQDESLQERYYVFGPYGVDGIFISPGEAVNLAYEVSGTVTDQKGEIVWRKGNRAARNQIMAIEEAGVSEEKGALAVCLDTVLGYEGISRNTQYLLDRGETVLQVLEDNLISATILDLTGCSLDAALYYVDRDIPVLALLENGSAVLLVGFNEFNVGILDPAKGTIDKIGMKDSAAWFEEYGNQFITYRFP